MELLEPERSLKLRSSHARETYILRESLTLEAGASYAKRESYALDRKLMHAGRSSYTGKERHTIGNSQKKTDN